MGPSRLVGADLGAGGGDLARAASAASVIDRVARPDESTRGRPLTPVPEPESSPWRVRRRASERIVARQEADHSGSDTAEVICRARDVGVVTVVVKPGDRAAGC